MKLTNIFLFLVAHETICMKKIALYLLTLFVFTNSIAQDKDVKNIILLNSYHSGFKWTDDITHGAINALQEHGGYRVFVEYMDFKRFHTHDFSNDLEKLYIDKYAQQKIDGIICSDNYAFKFVLDKGNDIWGTDVPISFCGVNNIDEISYDQSRIKGVKEDIDVKNTIDIILRNHPKTKSLIIISDRTLSGNIFSQQVIKELKESYPTLPYEMVDGTDYSLLKFQLHNISGDNKVIILLSLYTNKHSIPLEMIDYGKEIFDNLNSPVYSFWDFLLDDFIVGGSLISSYDQGYRAAQILHEQIISNNTLPTASLEPSIHYNKFDNIILKKFHINPANLPQDAIIVQKNMPFWIRYKNRIILASVMLTLLILVNFILIYNIVKRKRTELQLKKSEERLELALNSANEGLWDVWFDEKKLFFNNNLIKLLGYDNAKNANININNWKNFICKDDYDQLKEVYRLHMDKITDIFHCELRLIRNDGSYLWCGLHGKVTEYNVRNKPSRITGVIIDINEQKKFEEQLRLAKEKAEESDRLKSSFLANMSHEIRTPMNAIIGFSDILTEQKIDINDQILYLNQIKHSSEKLLTIINDIVDISKIESGQLNINNESFDIDELFEHLQITAQSLLKGKNNIQLIIEKGKIMDGYHIYTDPFRLEQVLLNLISNAIKYTEDGYIKIAYHVIDNKEITFEVTDSGEGIAPRDQAIIFERFRQAETSSRKLLSGTGLGLSISKSLVELMHGAIQVQSTLHKGSKFTVTLPLTLVPQNNYIHN